MRMKASVFVVASVAAVLLSTGLVATSSQARPAVDAKTTQLLNEPAVLGSVHSVHTDGPSDLVGFDWDGNAQGAVELRVRNGTEWSAWTKVEGDAAEGPDTDSREYHGRTSAGPVWVGHDRHDMQVRIAAGRLDHLRVHTIRSEEPSGRPGIPRASGEPAWPNVISRASWQADESWRNCPPVYASGLRNSVVHHTASTSAYSPDDVPSILRAIYYFHTKTNGWCDIGYNFLVDNFGRVWEGRYGGVDRAVIGAHAGGFNTGSTGVALIGTFQSTPVPAAAYNGLRSLLAWRLGISGVDPGATITVTAGAFDGSRYPTGAQVRVAAVSGHRDLDSTDCPGDAGYSNLDRLRNDVRRDIASSARWHDYLPQGTGLSSGPAIASWGNDRLDTAVRGTDGSIWHQWYDGAGWHSGESLGRPAPGIAPSAPSLVSWAPGRLDLFVQGADNQLWHRWYEGGWSGWEPLSSPTAGISSGPGVASWAPNRLDVFARGPGDGLWHRWWAGRWSAWENLGGRLGSAPAAVSWESGRIDVAVRGTDGALWHKWYGPGWSAWETLGGVLLDGPAISSWAPGRLDIFVVGADGRLYQDWYAGGWSGWGGLGGVFSDQPGAVSWGPNRIDIVVRGTDGRGWRQWWG